MSTLRLNGVVITLNGVALYLNGPDTVIVIVASTERTIYVPSENRTAIVDAAEVPPTTFTVSGETRTATPASITENRTIYVSPENRFVSAI